MGSVVNVLLGGEGLLGRALQRKLIARGEHTLVFDIKSGFDLRTEPLPRLPDDSYVWFLAWDVGGAKYIMDANEQLNILRANIQLCDAVFTMLSQRRLPFSFVSTQMIDYKNAYGITKRLGEFWASMAGNGKALISRLWNIYDAEEPSKRSHVIPDLVAQGTSGSISLMTDGQERRQFLHADDCAEALLHQRSTGQSRADITSGDWISIERVAQIIAEEFDARVIVSSKIGYESLTDPDMPLKGWTPKIALEGGLRMVVARMREEGWV